MGRPSSRSDVFSAGLVIYRMLTSHLPEWPFDWPPEGFARLRRHGPELTEFVRRSIEVRSKKRYADAEAMLAAFRKIEPTVRKRAARARAKRKREATR